MIFFKNFNRVKSELLLFTFFFIFSVTVFSQKKSEILRAFQEGTFNGHIRSLTMATDNEAELKDYFTTGIGFGGLYQSDTMFNHFQFGIDAFAMFNLYDNGLADPDSVTGKISRYEIGMYDLDNPGRYDRMVKLREFYVNYVFGKSYISYGNHVLNTPFINMQDGRLSPVTTQGFWSEINELKKFQFHLGWIHQISPRSTIGWYTVGESIGKYPVGRNESGKTSQYSGNLKSSGITIVNANYKPKKNVEIQFWNYFVENIFNTAFLQADVKPKLSENNNLILGLQLTHQSTVNNGGNEDQNKAYFENGNESNIISSRLGFRHKTFTINLNYTRITKDGRYLNPREWARDPFYTFLPREKNEGFGDMHAFAINLIGNFKKAGLKANLSFAYTKHPDIKKEIELNKYAMPSYYHLLWKSTYKFKGFLKGLSMLVIIAHKINAGETYNNPNFIFNKVNMTNYNLAFNYKF